MFTQTACSHTNSPLPCAVSMFCPQVTSAWLYIRPLLLQNKSVYRKLSVSFAPLVCGLAESGMMFLYSFSLSFSFCPFYLSGTIRHDSGRDATQIGIVVLGYMEVKGFCRL